MFEDFRCLSLSTLPAHLRWTVLGDQDSTPVPQADGLDPVIAVALAAGRRAGERLTSTPLTPRQRAAVAAVMGGGR